MFNPSLQISEHTIRASATLTGSYVAGTDISMDGHNYAGLIIDYTKGDETSMEVKVEISHDGGTTWFQQVAEEVTSGTVAVSLSERQFTATGKYALQVYPVRADLIRVSVKATGGTPTGTVAITGEITWA